MKKNIRIWLLSLVLFSIACDPVIEPPPPPPPPPPSDTVTIKTTASFYDRHGNPLEDKYVDIKKLRLTVEAAAFVGPEYKDQGFYFVETSGNNLKEFSTTITGPVATKMIGYPAKVSWRLILGYGAKYDVNDGTKTLYLADVQQMGFGAATEIPQVKKGLNTVEVKIMVSY